MCRIVSFLLLLIAGCLPQNVHAGVSDTDFTAVPLHCVCASSHQEKKVGMKIVGSKVADGYLQHVRLVTNVYELDKWYLRDSRPVQIKIKIPDQNTMKQINSTSTLSNSYYLNIRSNRGIGKWFRSIDRYEISSTRRGRVSMPLQLDTANPGIVRLLQDTSFYREYRQKVSGSRHLRSRYYATPGDYIMEIYIDRKSGLLHFVLDNQTCDLHSKDYNVVWERGSIHSL
ncbi:MAG: hypothetical protein H6585_02505 [Flavobacteriales bacterium]|nr:hypothetical protein [Flavobacteriales bacterium]MCB9447200.1 hypothetical protein [Flavobacteriales bacterium]